MSRRNRILGVAICSIFSVALFQTPASSGPPAPRKVFAISHQNFGNPGNPSDTIMFYDVTDVGSGSASDVFNNSPLFSVWLGYEIFKGEAQDLPDGLPSGNQEDVSAITFNPANGTIYAAAYDSNLGGPGNPDEVGDSTGDWDLYRVDYQEILDDFVTNSRPKGTIYAPPRQAISTDNELFLQSIGSQLFDGTVDGLAHNIPHPEGLTSTVHLDDAIQKVGELGRTQPTVTFFDSEIDFIDPETLVFLDTASGTTTASDFQIRQWKRVDTVRGSAVIDNDGPDNITGPPGTSGTEDDQQGGRNGQDGSPNSVLITESWEATIAGRLEMDAAGDTESNPTGWTLVNQNGTLGVWVADSDGGGDDVSYFALDFSDPANPTATKQELFTSTGGDPFPTAFAMDEDPSSDTTTNDGEIDNLRVDRNGNLVIVESGFFDTDPAGTGQAGDGGLPAEEPRTITVQIADYNSPDSDASGASEVLPAGPSGTGFNDPAAWSTPQLLDVSGPIDNDPDVTDSRRVAYDKGTGYIYFIDQDTGFTEDIYVFDPATGTIVYSELGALNLGIFNTGTQIVFTRGDITGDGVISAQDIDQLAAAVADPTQGGKFTSAVGQEFYDLTGDSALAAADVDALVQNILGTQYGDHDLDGDVDADDLAAWQAGFDTANTSWANGNTDGDSDVDGADFLRWQLHAGFTNMALAASTAVPEPASLLLCGLGLAVVSLTRRRR